MGKGLAKECEELDAEARAEGLASGRSASILTVLEARGIVVSPDAERRARACADPAILDLWLRRALTVADANELLDAKNRPRARVGYFGARSSDRSHKPWSEMDTEYIRSVLRAVARGRAESILIVLDERGIAVSPELRERILACTDLERLDGWTWRAVKVSDANELFVGKVERPPLRADQIRQYIERQLRLGEQLCVLRKDEGPGYAQAMGRSTGLAEALLTVLQHRKIPVYQKDIDAIFRTEHDEDLYEMLRQSLTVQSADELYDDEDDDGEDDEDDDEDA